ncbi:MAG: hypothetical protein CR975_00025 [Gammaproteobacteria bacterium]|nr:MAG: hypothetical protein CR975_00025 [Gammaproteobacteria bacterium]
MKYTNLIIIQHPLSALRFKEALDIALVSASYEITAAVFINSDTIKYYQNAPQSLELEQVVNMLGEFCVPLFSDKKHSLYQNAFNPIALSALTNNSKHQFRVGKAG